MREFIGDHIQIDGRMIGYRIFTASQYLEEKYPEWSESKLDKFIDKNYSLYEMLNQVMALKQSCFLLRRVSYSCGSLSDCLFNLKLELIQKLKNEYNFEFDEDLVESYCEGD